tara:strand:- start:4230 stop:5018 length:789 start_codon:yes stop_codon:yes gene_type:complete
MSSKVETSYFDDFGPGSLDRAVNLIRFLREHCEWDRSQTPEKLIPHLLEESHEVVEAIRSGQDKDLEGELGDLLLNLAFQIVLGEERGAFTANSISKRLEEKMKRRHPDLFGLGDKTGWEAIKAKERKDNTSLLDSLPKTLDPLHRAHRIQDRVSGIGFDWPDAWGAWEKVSEEVEEVKDAMEKKSSRDIEEELGDLIFAIVNLVRLTGGHSAKSLELANQKFIKRFKQLETVATELKIVLEETTLEEMNIIWDKIKEEDKG